MPTAPPFDELPTSKAGCPYCSGRASLQIKNHWGAPPLCGVAGIYIRDGRDVDLAVLDGMTDALAHRGPDGRGIWRAGGIGLGHRRLAIRDLSERATQPFFSQCGQVVVSYNGEIYNERALADELTREHGLIRHTSCDTEILPAGWLAWELGVLERLEGMFAFALWDNRTQTLVLARDGAGIKPLYFSDNGMTVRFASEPKALLADPKFRPGISARDVAQLLALGYSSPQRCLLQDVEQIAPGCALIFDRSGRREYRYWSPSRRPSVTSLSHATELFIDTFSRVVSDQLVADVPVAVLQSGGVDSSLISLSLPAHTDVRLYTVGFQEQDFDETAEAAAVARATERELVLLKLSPEDAEQDFEEVVRSVDGMLADSSAFATYRLSRAVRTQAKVALSGDGADEFFGGYYTYCATAMAQWLRPLLPLAGWRRLAQSLGHHGGDERRRLSTIDVVQRLLYGLSCQVPHAGWRYYTPSWQRSSLYGPALRDYLQWDPLSDYASEFGAEGLSTWDRSMLADQRYYLPADMLLKLDRTSMAHGLEVRVPMLDRRIMDLAASFDRKLLVRCAKETKRVLRSAAERLGAPANIVRGSKRGFNVPMTKLLRTGLWRLADRLLDSHADILAPYCSAGAVRRVWRDHCAGIADHRYIVWALLTLATWKKVQGL